MTPLIKSGQEHVLSPINLSDVEVGDIVFCKVKGRYYTHLVKAKGDRGVLIGNNHGKINGWTKSVFGKVTSTSLAEESAKIIDVFEKAVTNLKEVASKAQAEKEVREQEIIELQTEAANLEAVSNKATAMAEKIGGLLS